MLHQKHHHPNPRKEDKEWKRKVGGNEYTIVLRGKQKKVGDKIIITGRRKKKRNRKLWNGWGPLPTTQEPPEVYLCLRNQHCLGTQASAKVYSKHLRPFSQPAHFVQSPDGSPSKWKVVWCGLFLGSLCGLQRLISPWVWTPSPSFYPRTFTTPAAFSAALLLLSYRDLPLPCVPAGSDRVILCPDIFYAEWSCPFLFRKHQLPSVAMDLCDPCSPNLIWKDSLLSSSVLSGLSSSWALRPDTLYWSSSLHHYVCPEKGYSCFPWPFHSDLSKICLWIT
jgi:hypothetical protein